MGMKKHTLAPIPPPLPPKQETLAPVVPPAMKKALPYRASILPMDRDHVYEVWRLWKELNAEIHQRYPSMTKDDEEMFLKILYGTLQFPHVYGVFMAKVGKEIIGFVAGRMSERPLGQPRRYAEALYFYVRPEYRNRVDIAPALNRMGEEWARSQGAGYLELSTLWDKSLVQRWMKKGFHPWLVWMYKRLED